jgi:hypothetical protein
VAGRHRLDRRADRVAAVFVAVLGVVGVLTGLLLSPVRRRRP